MITWAGKDTGLFQSDLLVPVHSQLQAAAQLLIHRAAFALVGAVGHEAGQVSVAHAVSTHHTLTGQEHHSKRRRMMMRWCSYMDLQPLGDCLIIVIYSCGWKFCPSAILIDKFILSFQN